VDTHVGRLSRRLGLTKQTDPVKVELALMEIVPKEKWTEFSHELILHGRNICDARKPLCETCTLNELCPKIGVKKSPTKPKAKKKVETRITPAKTKGRTTRGRR
jgi:endonuclease-3